MSSETRLLRLSPLQVEYVTHAAYLPQLLRQAILPGADDLAVHEVEIDTQTADVLQSAFTDRLAQAGFDEDYELTAEGEILEGLIDLLGSGSGL